MNHVYTDTEDFKKRLTQGMKSDQTPATHNVRRQTETEKSYPKGPLLGYNRIRQAAGLLNPRSFFELYSRWPHNP